MLDDYSRFSKESVLKYQVSFWEMMKARIFGQKFDELRITAYYYKDKFYITRIL